MKFFFFQLNEAVETIKPQNLFTSITLFTSGEGGGVNGNFREKIDCFVYSRNIKWLSVMRREGRQIWPENRRSRCVANRVSGDYLSEQLKLTGTDKYWSNEFWIDLRLQNVYCCMHKWKLVDQKTNSLLYYIFYVDDRQNQTRPTQNSRSEKKLTHGHACPRPSPAQSTRAESSLSDEWFKIYTIS